MKARHAVLVAIAAARSPNSMGIHKEGGTLMVRTLTALALGLAALLIPASASGVWGGSLDTTHPQVGAMYIDYEGTGEPRVDGQVCSGSYAGESKDEQNDVFLLAGHCLFGPAASELFVSFDSNASVADIDDPVADPIPVQAIHQMPGLWHDKGDPRDLGILLLPKDSVPTGIAPVQLAPAGYLDALKKAGTLTFRPITIAGYGVTPIWEPAGPTMYEFDGKRRSGTTVITGLGKAFVRMSQNEGIGTGNGVCFGDSGSPQIDENVSPPVVISVTTGGNRQCNADNYDYRVDTPQARAFLGQYLNLP